MRNVFYFFSVITILFMLSCEKDDICPDSTETTPKLIVTFNDAQNQDERKIVESLSVFAFKDNEMILIQNISTINTDSIAIPLRNEIANAKFKLFKNSSFIDDMIIQGEKTHLELNYGINEVFVSRACGFINNYELESNIYTIDPTDSDQTSSWIIDYIINNPTVSNENQSHVILLH